MSSQKGNVTRTRPQRHQNAFSFKNDKFDTSIQTKRINAKLHDGVCHHCKEVLEWRVKYSKYKPLSKPKKCFSADPGLLTRQKRSFCRNNRDSTLPHSGLGSVSCLPSSLCLPSA
ncbi:uncharacterized protein C9orf85 homolog isoform X3 [Sminthopsis crassicaudata]|uniref:uncharacterized protein C9orf85 homolog isoform X3 n=1 Tax=Sminthopsis crassicaudata TaxID=9301 RepID=UPI003D69BA99